MQEGHAENLDDKHHQSKKEICCSSTGSARSTMRD